MRLMVSCLTDTVTVHAGDLHLPIAPGAVVDFDTPVGSGTLEDALGACAQSFHPCTEEEPGPQLDPAVASELEPGEVIDPAAHAAAIESGSITPKPKRRKSAQTEE